MGARDVPISSKDKKKKGKGKKKKKKKAKAAANEEGTVAAKAVKGVSKKTQQKAAEEQDKKKKKQKAVEEDIDKLIAEVETAPGKGTGAGGKPTAAKAASKRPK